MAHTWAIVSIFQHLSRSGPRLPLSRRIRARFLELTMKPAFASMFPHRVGRMILDGNVDPIDYTATGWLSNLFDNNKNLHWFYYDCFHAGPKCAFFAEGTMS